MIDMTYGELVDSLRKDLQLDATIDVLRGTIAPALINDAAALSQPAIKKLLLSLGISYGTVNFTWASSSISGSQVVTHGFTQAPTAILLSPSTSNFLGGVVTVNGATTFTANGFSTPNTTIASSTFTYYWAAFK